MVGRGRGIWLVAGLALPRLVWSDVACVMLQLLLAVLVIQYPYRSSRCRGGNVNARAKDVVLIKIKVVKIWP